MRSGARSIPDAKRWFGYANFDDPSKIGVAVSRSPAGPFHNIAAHPIDYNPYDRYPGLSKAAMLRQIWQDESLEALQPLLLDLLERWATMSRAGRSAMASAANVSVDAKSRCNAVISSTGPRSARNSRTSLSSGVPLG